jgi:hypothetical protein
MIDLAAIRIDSLLSSHCLSKSRSNFDSRSVAHVAPHSAFRSWTRLGRKSGHRSRLASLARFGVWVAIFLLGGQLSWESVSVSELGTASSLQAAEQAPNQAPNQAREQAAAVGAEPSFEPAAIEFFEKEVRPVLANRCYECHSVDSKKVQGGLLLDSRAAVLKGGDTGPAAVPGKPKESLLVEAINYGETYQMPPKSRLPAAEIAALTRWVELGLPWPKESPRKPNVKSPVFDLASRKAGHWCWQPIQDPALPAVKDAAWPSQPLDRFILARLESAGLRPAPDAEKALLLRRASFDLIGLPPTRAEIKAFLDDTSPQAFEKAVDGLLRSPHFGERWARHWMDLVRYAETYGHEFDYPIPHASEYRDYLIRAYNDDVPYNQFVIEHLAGDLLTQPRRHRERGFNESILGTGFWFLGEATHAPVDVRNDEMGRIDNQLDVMSKSFLGVTLACARCHDHKFDAISTRDYYAMAGVLKSSRRQEALLDPDGRIANGTRELETLRGRGDGALAATASSAAASPKLSETFVAGLLAAREIRSQGPGSVDTVAMIRGLDTEVARRWAAALEDPQVRQLNHPLQPWFEVSEPKVEATRGRLAGIRKRLDDAAKRGAEFRERSPVAVDFDRGSYDEAWPTGWAFGERPTTAGQWDASSTAAQLTRPGVADSAARSKREQGVLRSNTFTLTHRHLLYKVKGHNAQIRLYIDNYFMDVYNGLLFGGCNQRIDNRPTWGWLVQGGDVSRYVGHKVYFEVLDMGDGFAALDEVRLSDSGPPPDDENPLGLRVVAETLEAANTGDQGPDVSLGEPLAQRFAKAIESAIRAWSERKLDGDQTELVNWLLRHDLLPESAKLSTARGTLSGLFPQLEQNASAIPAPLRALAIADGDGQDDRVHIRGNHRTLGEPAPRRLLEALETPPVPTAERGSGRLRIAEAIVAPGNPLTARVAVNRAWHHLFGRGIVPSVDNFGALGQTPSHPELLDHLASRFVADGWSWKRLLRTLVLSRSYRMSSAPDSKGDEVDPQNILLHRQNIRRLQGEAIRDAVLRISGRLDPALYGRSVPVHLTPFMQGRGRPGGSGPLDGGGRRSLYVEVRRNFLSPMMIAYDAPIPFSTVGARNTSNVPAQALILMNDPFILEQSRKWAERVIADGDAAAERRIERMYEDALGRPPSADELMSAVEFLETQGAEYQLDAAAARRDPRVLADFGHVLWNVKEFVYLP